MIKHQSPWYKGIDNPTIKFEAVDVIKNLDWYELIQHFSQSHNIQQSLRLMAFSVWFWLLVSELCQKLSMISMSHICIHRSFLLIYSHCHLAVIFAFWFDRPQHAYDYFSLIRYGNCLTLQDQNTVTSFQIEK